MFIKIKHKVYVPFNSKQHTELIVSVHLLQRIPEFKSFEELELPKHSKVKRQTSTPNASDLEQQPEISVEEWQNKPTHEILHKFHVS